MRHGYTPELADILESVPRTARPMVQTVVTIQSDIKDTLSDFDGADSTAGFFNYLEGGTRLSGAGTTIQAENTTRLTGADITALTLPFSGTVDVAVVEWGGVGPDKIELFSATAYLDPDVDSGGADVTTWVCQLFRVAKVIGIGIENTWELVPISDRPQVTATGSAGDVTFVFAAGQSVPVVGQRPEMDDAARGEGLSALPMTVMMIWALLGTGELAGNVAWEADSGNSSVVDGDHEVFRYQLNSVDNADELGNLKYVVTSPIAGVPAMALRGNLYSDAVMTWSAAGASNEIDLGAAPGGATILELVLEAAEPGDSAVVGQIDDGVAGFTTFVDGDQIGVDRTAQGGTDLSSIVRQQNYDIRIDVDASSDTLATPRVFRVGVREVTLEDVDALVEFRGSAYAIDPVTCASEIPTLNLTLHRDGVNDYRSWAEELFATNHVNDFVFRIWIGHPDLARRYWLHIDDFLVDTYVPTTLGIEVACVSPLQYVLANIPPKVTATRSAIVYAASTLADTYADILSGQVGVAGRFIGPGITDDTTTVTKTIREKVQAVDVLRELNFLDGSVTISSQGRFKVVSLFDGQPQEEAAVFPRDDIQILGIDLGTDRRLTEYDVSYGFTEDTNQFEAEREHAAADAVIANIGPTAVGQDAQLDDSTAKWIEDSTHADVIGNRMVTHFATGMAQIRFRSATPKPWLEAGSPCSVEQDIYVARDPTTGDGIRGKAWALCRITQCHDLIGTEFTAWVRSWVPFLTSGTGITRDVRTSVTVTIPASSFSDTGGSELVPSTSGSTETFSATLPLKEGDTITAIKTRATRIGANDIALILLSTVPSYPDSPPLAIVFTLETNAHSANASSWTEVNTTGISRTVASVPFPLSVTLRGDTTATDAKLAWVQITYDTDAPEARTI